MMQVDARRRASPNVGADELSGRIDDRLLFVPNRVVVVSHSMLMSRNASATSTMAMPA
jgi:hypothetical protein